MSREELVGRTFVDLADTLVDQYEVIDFVQLLAERCVELLGAEEAGIMLDDQEGHLRVLASSSERMRVLELFELQGEDGPCLDCFHSGEAVREDDLEAGLDRWPRFARSALEAGFLSVYALPMRLRQDRIGALNLFSTSSAGLPEADEVLGQALADVATIGILQERFSREHQALAEQLQRALNTRVVLEQAKGRLAQQGTIDVDQAFIVLRRYARNQNIRLSEAAQAVMQGRLNAEALQGRFAAGSHHD